MTNEEIRAAVEGAIAGHQVGQDMDEYDSEHRSLSGRIMHRKLKVDWTQPHNVAIEQWKRLFMAREAVVGVARIEEAIAVSRALGVNVRAGDGLIDTLDLVGTDFDDLP